METHSGSSATHSGRARIRALGRRVEALPRGPEKPTAGGGRGSPKRINSLNPWEVEVRPVAASRCGQSLLRVEHSMSGLEHVGSVGAE